MNKVRFYILSLTLVLGAMLLASSCTKGKPDVIYPKVTMSDLTTPIFLYYDSGIASIYFYSFNGSRAATGSISTVGEDAMLRCDALHESWSIDGEGNLKLGNSTYPMQYATNHGVTIISINGVVLLASNSTVNGEILEKRLDITRERLWQAIEDAHANSTAVPL